MSGTSNPQKLTSLSQQALTNRRLEVATKWAPREEEYRREARFRCVMCKGTNIKIAAWVDVNRRFVWVSELEPFGEFGCTETQRCQDCDGPAEFEPGEGLEWRREA